VSHNGAVIGSASLNGVLLNGGSVTVSGLPSGVGNYYLSAIVWNTSNPSGTFKYESVGSAVTVSAGGSTSAAVTID
jgi:hypothetical protein